MPENTKTVQIAILILNSIKRDINRIKEERL